MNAEKIDKKYIITEQLSASEVYYAGKGYAFHEGNRLYLTNANSEYGYDFYIIPSESFMKEFNEVDEIPKIMLLMRMYDEIDRSYYGVETIVYSPEYRYTEVDFEVIYIDHDPNHYIKSSDMGYENLYKVDRYVDELYFDWETCEYVDNEGILYDLEIVE